MLLNKYTHTCILKPLEDNEPTGLKVDIAHCKLSSNNGIVKWGHRQVIITGWSCEVGLSSVLGHYAVAEDTVSFHHTMELGGEDTDKLQ